jgi:hypothetical protein
MSRLAVGLGRKHLRHSRCRFVDDGSHRFLGRVLVA